MKDDNDPIKNTKNDKRCLGSEKKLREKQHCPIQDKSLEGKSYIQQYVPASLADDSEAGPSDILTNKERSGREKLINNDIELPYNDLKTILSLIDKSISAPRHGCNEGK